MVPGCPGIPWSGEPTYRPVPGLPRYSRFQPVYSPGHLSTTPILSSGYKPSLACNLLSSLSSIQLPFPHLLPCTPSRPVKPNKRPNNSLNRLNRLNRLRIKYRVKYRIKFNKLINLVYNVQRLYIIL